ncbi:MAG: MliC family protein [Burkholderiales bacterium]|nr:MliC family protein [Burkholderiales bacterium]
MNLIFPSRVYSLGAVVVAAGLAAMAFGAAAQAAQPAHPNSCRDGTCAREAAPPPTASGVPARVKARFTCVGGKSIDATFINTGNRRVRLTLPDGRKMTLPQAVAADGARYANTQETVVFWNKGNTAFMQENGQTTYAECVATR